jgi:DNA polymerase-3 subunit alpha
MEKFAEYGFNKSHSAAYALVSYQTAWLKAHYPAEFMAAVLSADMDNTDKVVVLIEECRQMDQKVLPPDINRSELRFAVNEQGAILYGLGAVKGVGASAIGEIVEERERHGPFRDLLDLCRRIDLRKVNRRVLEALVRAGALDSLDANRAAHLAALPESMRVAEQHLAMDATGQNDLFGLEPAPSTGPTASAGVTVEPWAERERLAHEKATLGLYLTGHPIGEYESELASIITSKLGALSLDGQRGGGRQEMRVVVAGLVVELRARQSKTGKRMAFATLDDRTGRVEVAVFSEAFEQSREALTKDTLVVVEGTLAMDDYTGQTRLSAERIHTIEAARARFARQLLINWPAPGADRSELEAGRLVQLKAVLKPFQGGGCPIVIDYRGAGAETRLELGLEWRVHPAEDLLQRLRKTLGRERVRLLYH